MLRIKLSGPRVNRQAPSNSGEAFYFILKQMNSNSEKILEISCDDFVRRFSMRKGSLMWLLGAGASASAGIPTATDMVWEFKQQLYISQRRVAAQSVADLSSPLIRDRIQAHIDSLGNMPSANSKDEYATLFEAVYPAETDRRTYINSKMSGAKPSYGHIALASLMKAGITKLIWTTNFDPLIADACAKVYDGTGPLTTVALEASQIAEDCISEERWPLEVKLHGDFRSRRLKNTQEELRYQDAHIRRLLVEACGRYGMVISGYSGRDDSIMATLEDAAVSSDAFPAGVFWLHRGTGPPIQRVKDLIGMAAARGIEAAIVRVENFDEVMRDLIRICTEIDSKVLDSFGTERQRVSNAPLSVGKVGWPVVRLNAIPITKVPTVCRKVVCQINGFRELREAVKEAQVDLLVTRTRAGVLLFGSDADLKTAFEKYGITEIDLYPIEQRRLRYDSSERGLLREALSAALARNRQLVLTRQRNSDLLYPSNPTDEIWKPLRSIAKNLSGQIPNSDLRWFEGIGIRLDWAGDRLWLLIEPRTVFEGITDENKSLSASFARERTVSRYNRQLNDLVNFWTQMLVGDAKILGALGVTDGVDAQFELSLPNGFSRRVGA